MKNVSLDINERSLLEVRKHWFIFLIEAIGSLLAGLAPIVIALMFIMWFDLSLSPKLFYFGGFFYMIWLLLVWIYFFLIWTDYYLDVWIITDQKIIDIDQKSLFHREVSTFRLDHIQDVTIKVPGFLPTLLDYGHLHVQTAGEQNEFIIRFAAHPQQVKDVILKEYKREFLASRRPDEPTD